MGGNTYFPMEEVTEYYPDPGEAFRAESKYMWGQVSRHVRLLRQGSDGSGEPFSYVGSLV